MRARCSHIRPNESSSVIKCVRFEVPAYKSNIFFSRHHLFLVLLAGTKTIFNVIEMQYLMETAAVSMRNQTTKLYHNSVRERVHDEIRVIVE